ncbi:hypothetical protein PGT21_011446 [Puccinia graminis f. sp. tritici]|uniref:Cyanovirin-N domain-containing protein n=1 Tax=Puccinia graminis f. sp. tritici TaxID=56615 RepID=A0A5B0PXC6_PUCGR|nr:hypothetical protein PGT21_011446 [Puccinia graminis f. sp. tritici]KAA1127746.1 hypothetical protein PGTUg99_001378 [Puccinia graminis f. sp. tritici]
MFAINMNAFFSCLIFITLLNPSLSLKFDATLTVKNPDSYSRAYVTDTFRVDLHNRAYRCDKCDLYVATGCNQAAGSDLPADHTCELQYLPKQGYIACESRCKGTDIGVTYNCKAKKQSGDKICTGCMELI